MAVAYDPVLVVLSILIAIIASYTALDLAGRVSASAGRARLAWLLAGSFAMGVGIWSMHFVGMLSFSLSIPIGYQVPLVLLSALVAIGASLLALLVAGRQHMGLASLLAGGASMGPAIAGMHYIGMAAMRMDARTSYDPPLVAVSVLIAVGASLAALWLAHRFRGEQTRRGAWGKVASAIVMGAAIAGMHYTAMAAARFTPAREGLASHATFVLAGSALSAAVALSTLLILATALAGSAIHQRVNVRLLETIRASEAAIRGHEAFLRQVIDADPNLLFVKDWDGRFTLANKALAEVYGTTAEALTGKTDADFNPNQEEVEHFLRDDREVMTSLGRKFIREEPVTNPQTGATRWFQTVKLPLLEPDGTARQVLGVATDITEAKQLEAQLRQAQKIEAIGQLTGGIAHDLNNILTVILTNADLVAGALAPEHRELRADVAELVGAARRGATMVRKLLAFSRRETLALKPVDLGHLIADLTSTLRRLLPSTIEMRVHAEADLPAVRADPGAVEQMVLNLATNARDALPAGGLLRIETINAWMDAESCATHGFGTPGAYVAVAVSDTGTGMTAEIQARVFEPFFTTKPPDAGTGLGLAMVYGLMRQHEGYTKVYSEPGHGTTVKLYFPALESSLPDQADKAPVPALRGGTETILVAEDEESIRRAAKRALERFGYRVLLAADGQEALNTLKTSGGRIALVLSDIVMPRLGGRELLERVRRDAIPVRFLLTSGYTARDVRETAHLDPEVPFLHKPWTVSELLLKVREVLDSGAA